MTRKSVDKWIRKALAMGSDAALKDAYHRPKEPLITEEAKAWVIHLACSKPKDLGYAAEVWTRSALARHVREHAPKAGYASLARAAKATVHRILAEQPLHPERVKYYLERRDPEFETKMREVLLVYQEVALQNQNGGGMIPMIISKRFGKRLIAEVGELPAIGREGRWNQVVCALDQRLRLAGSIRASSVDAIAIARENHVLTIRTPNRASSASAICFA